MQLAMLQECCRHRPVSTGPLSEQQRPPAAAAAATTAATAAACLLSHIAGASGSRGSGSGQA